MNFNLKTNEKGNLSIGGVDAVKLAHEYGTPLYVIDEERIRDNYQRLYNIFSDKYSNFKIYYACKANTNLSVMRILEEEGSNIDAVSPGEIYTALITGFKPDRILYTGNNVTDEELEFALKTGVRINLDSISQLKRLSKLSDSEGTEISFRINPKVGAGHHDHCITGGELSKFGIMEEEAVHAYQKALDLGFKPVGIHSHIGSGILDPEPFKLAVHTLMDTAGRVYREAEVEFEFIDFGGGIGIPYEPHESILNLEKFAEEIIDLFKEKLYEYNMGNPSIYLEPGRYLVGDAAYLLTKVNTIKQSYHKFAGVDAGFNTLLRPTMYDSYHHIVPITNPNAKPTQEIDIAGNVCESGDLFARNRAMPELSEGDLLAILNAGAYAFSMSSQYNSRPRAAEILVFNGLSEIVRERETFSDLFNKQNIPWRLLK